MLPAVGLVSLAWVMLCLFPELEARDTVIPNGKTRCCSCTDLMPYDTPSDTKYQTMPSPFKIEVTEDKYSQSRELSVSLVGTGGRRFTSFMLGAYHYGYHYNTGDKKRPLGTLTLLPGQTAKVMEACTEVTGSAVTNADNDPKDVIKFSWKPGKETKGHIEFRATFVENDRTYWVSEKSKIIEDPKSKQKLLRSRHIPAIDLSECGISKGCFREPAGCSEPQCLYVLTWRDHYSTDFNTPTTEFELGGLTHGAQDSYVAFGISKDKYMGDDTVFTCAHSSARDTTEVYASYNQIDPKRNTPIRKYKDSDSQFAEKEYDMIVREEGSFLSQRLRCRFTVTKALGEHTADKMMDITGEPSHLMFTEGYASRGAPHDPWMKYEEVPKVSADKIDLTSTDQYTGWTTYPLAKAHAILMIIAWILCNSIGMLLSKYYQKMWPNRDIFGHKYWFFGHFNLLSATFVITIISIIIIFVETGGYSEAPDLSLKAHPILGIIIFVCILIIPFIACLRPAEPGNCQTIFNWFYWLFCTIANVLAIPNIFIGMDFGKVGVPWWATWILVIWVIFHIAVELTLEIHQCCTHKKNKEKRKKYELAKKEHPKQHIPEPELAGRRFKRFMLSLHVGITILITLIMVIIIAVS